MNNKFDIMYIYINLINNIKMEESNILVAIRCRPLNTKE